MPIPAVPAQPRTALDRCDNAHSTDCSSSTYPCPRVACKCLVTRVDVAPCKTRHSTGIVESRHCIPLRVSGSLITGAHPGAGLNPAVPETGKATSKSATNQGRTTFRYAVSSPWEPRISGKVPEYILVSVPPPCWEYDAPGSQAASHPKLAHAFASTTASASHPAPQLHGVLLQSHRDASLDWLIRAAGPDLSFTS